MIPILKEYNATDLSRKAKEVMESASAEPIIIRSQRSAPCVMMSREEYALLLANQKKRR